jgi:hypothetical protein
MNDEQLESLLRAADGSAGPSAAPPPGLAHRARTTHARRCRRTRRIKLASALSGCYVAGMITMWIVLRPAAVGRSDVAPRPSTPSNSSQAGIDTQPTPRPEHDAPTPPIEPPASIQPPLGVETSRYELLRQLGDESQRRGDLQTAVAYYSQALDAATDQERRISYQQDNWLLISLKTGRLSSEHPPTQGDST